MTTGALSWQGLARRGLAAVFALGLAGCGKSGSSSDASAVGDGATSPIPIGAPCTDDTQCGPNPKGVCNVAGEGFPGGYCSMEDCMATQLCGAGATCIACEQQFQGILCRPQSTRGIQSWPQSIADIRRTEGSIQAADLDQRAHPRPF